MAKKIAKPAPKPAAKPAAKPAPKPAAKPLAKATPAPTPAPNPQSQLDLVRSPNFDAAMAQQNYQNLMRFQQAALAGNQDFIDSRDPNRAHTADMVDYIDPATGERTSRTRGVVPAPGSRFVPANGNKFNPNLMPEEEKQRLDKLVADFAMQGAGQRESDIARRNAAMMQYDQAMRAGGAGYAQVDPNIGMPRLMPIQTPGSDALNQDLANRGMGGGIPSPIPQGQQMPVPDQQQGARADQYQNFLQQGLASYAAQNYPQQQQGAMGAQAAQNYAGGPMPSPAIPSRKPIGGVTAQPRGLPRPRQPKGFRSPIGRSAF